MAAECPGCERTPAGGEPGRRFPARPTRVALASALLALLMPKCPLCIGAYLSLFGLTAGAVGVATTMLRPVFVALVVLAALALGYVVLSWARRRFLGS